MANRPCKPDADVKRIWQWLMPDTAFPACGTQDDAAARDSAKPADQPRQDAEARRDNPRRRRG
jgi:hypothetical protein